MHQDPMKMSYSFGTGLTPLGKKLLIIYGVIYVLELLLEHWFNLPIVSLLQLWPVSVDKFHFWQIITSPFIHDPNAPVGFLINCLLLYFFAGYVERITGATYFLVVFYSAALGAALCGLLFSSVSGFNKLFCGMMPSLLCLVVIFGMINPESTILLMFVIPIKAKYMSYGTILITFLTFLAKANPHGAYHLGGILFGWLVFKGPRNALDPNLLYLKYLQWQFNRKKKARFKVIDGYKDKNNDDKPTYH